MNNLNHTVPSAQVQMFSRISHDIRTPINAIMGYSVILENMASDPVKVREYAERIRLSGDTLLSLVNDVLDFSRLESSRGVMTKEKFDLLWVIEEVEAAVKPQSAMKSQDLRICIDPRGHGTVFNGDRGKVCRILINLLSNAVKYTQEQGHIKFDTYIAGDGEVVFCIEDDGRGMSADFAAVIFEPFTREETITPGTGLGMTIVKELTELMDGTIEIKSHPGEGTAVTVKFRLESA